MKTKNNKTEEAAAAPGAVETAKSPEQIRNEWLAIRKKAGRKIDPKTAEVMWTYAQTFDPYGVDPDPELPEEYHQVGREYFARSPGSDIWVWFGDLPPATREALWKKHTASLAFPAGLPPIKDNPSGVFRDDNGNCVVQLDEAELQEVYKVAEQSAKRTEQIRNVRGYRFAGPQSPR